MSLMFRWQLPHFSTQIAPALTQARQPFTVYLGPSREDMMAAVISVTRLTMERVRRAERRAALVTHHSGLLDSGSVLAKLQEENIDVQVELTRKVIMVKTDLWV